MSRVKFVYSNESEITILVLFGVGDIHHFILLACQNRINENFPLMSVRKAWAWQLVFTYIMHSDLSVVFKFYNMVSCYMK